VAKVRQQVDDAKIAELEAKHAEQAGEEQPAKEQAQAPVNVTQTQVRQQERQALADQGLKRCSQHAKLLTQLPEEAQQAIEGYPVEIRRLDAFGKSSSSSDGLQTFCKACDHLLMKQAREKAKANDPNAGTSSIARHEATIARKMAQYNALAREIDELNAHVRSMRDAQATVRDTNA
jgi:hypothetical protein